MLHEALLLLLVAPAFGHAIVGGRANATHSLRRASHLSAQEPLSAQEGTEPADVHDATGVHVPDGVDGATGFLLGGGASSGGAAAGGAGAAEGEQKGLVAPPGVRGLDNDPCFEASAQAQVIKQQATQKAELLGVYNDMFLTCPSGRHNLVCAARVEFADHPREYLKECEDSMGPQPINSGAICQYARGKRDSLKTLSSNYGTLSGMFDLLIGNCASTPMECIVFSELCLTSPDIKGCFRECLRTGRMQHMMTPNGPALHSIPQQNPGPGGQR